MADDLDVCAAAFFRCKGKDSVTEKEFVMGVSLDLRWMPVRDAEALLSALIETGSVARSGQHIRAPPALMGMDVPAAYRPPEGLLAARRPAKAAPAGGDLLSEMIGAAVAGGADKSEFVAECNRIRRRLGVSMAAAAYVALRESGAGREFSERAREAQRLTSS
ncbi:MAG: DUF2240 family protein [Candidatus Methanoplasma sp.]|jgi:hypothetical protein|nr:DUF2240 family protein [Candidatus Methanoplasma sp.]